MSMSQEEIEALMNGLDIAEEAPAEETRSVEETPAVEPKPVEETISADEIDDIIASTEVEETPSETLEPETNETICNDDIDDLLKGLEETAPSESIDIDNFDDVLSDIDGIVESTAPDVVEPAISDPVALADDEEHVLTDKDKDEIVKDWTDSKINEGIIPLPAEKDTKVVNQLNQVANDSEEKVGQIFDVLSLGLDNNNEFRNKISEMESFLEAQNKLLNSLHQKFPNISVFESNLSKISDVNETLTTMKNAMNEEDMKIFEAMELNAV